MKCIKIQVKPVKAQYAVQVGAYYQEFSNYRVAKKTAEDVGHELTGHLINLNMIYSELLMHYRKCWLLEAPFTLDIEKHIPGIDLMFNRCCHLPNPGRSIQNIIDILGEILLKMISFYKNRNYHAISMELRQLNQRIHDMETKIRVYAQK